MSLDRKHFMSSLAGVLVGGLLVAALPAIAASVGDPLALGEINSIDSRTDLKGDAKGANLQIKNTGNSSALTAKADRQAIVAKATSGPVAVNAKADRVAVKIKVDPGQAPLKVNATAGTATNLSADAVDGFHANQIIRAESVNGTAFNDFAGASEATPLALDITAPGPGMIITAATIDADESSFDTFHCHIAVDGMKIPGTEMRVVVHSTAGTKNNQEDCTTTGGVAVSAGAHTLTFELTNLDEAFFNDASLWAIFVPFDGTGATP